jgi:hypothetical protein
VIAVSILPDVCFTRGEIFTSESFVMRICFVSLDPKKVWTLRALRSMKLGLADTRHGK